MKPLKPADLTVIIDTREQVPFSFPCKTEPGTLDTGDYSVKGFERVCRIERKSLPDLLGSLGKERKRFDAEIMRLLAYPVKALIIEASWKELRDGLWSIHGRSRMHPNAVMGSLHAFAARGLPVIPAGNRASAETSAFAILWYGVKARWEEMRKVLERELAP